MELRTARRCWLSGRLIVYLLVRYMVHPSRLLLLYILYLYGTCTCTVGARSDIHEIHEMHYCPYERSPGAQSVTCPPAMRAPTAASPVPRR